MDISISGRRFLLGRISPCNAFQWRTDIYLRTDGIGTGGSLCRIPCSQKKSSCSVISDSIRCTADPGKYSVLYNERGCTGKYGRSVILWQSDTSVCIVHCGRNLYRMDIVIDFQKILCLTDKQSKIIVTVHR